MPGVMEAMNDWTNDTTGLIHTQRRRNVNVTQIRVSPREPGAWRPNHAAESLL